MCPLPSAGSEVVHKTENWNHTSTPRVPLVSLGTGLGYECTCVRLTSAQIVIPTCRKLHHEVLLHHIDNTRQVMASGLRPAWSENTLPTNG